VKNLSFEARSEEKPWEVGFSERILLNLAAEKWGKRAQTKYLWFIFIGPMSSILENCD